MRFIHIADVHLDTAFAGRSDDMRNRLRHAAREAFARCVDTAVGEQVDAVLIAGDLFDGGSLSFESERFLLAQLGRLAEADIQVVYATGNHDPGHGLRANGLDWPGNGLDWPGNVTLIPGPDPVTVPVKGRTGDIVGHVTGAGHATARETTDLSLRLEPVPDTALPQVAILHTQFTSATGRDVQPYSPSGIEHLRAAGFHYWALGHVHLRQELSADPPVLYCGNLQGRDPRESGPKGGLLVDLGDPAHPVIDFREFSRVRWEKVTVSGLEEVHTLDALVNEIAAAWNTARASDPGSDDTEWMVAVDLAGPSPMWRKLREAEEIATIEDEVASRLGALGAEVRAGRLHPAAQIDDHVDREDVLGAGLRLCGDVLSGKDRLGLADTDLAGFDPERDRTLDVYLRRLLAGGPEEIMTRMLVPRADLPRITENSEQEPPQEEQEARQEESTKEEEGAE